MNTKTLYFMTRIALVAVFAMGLLLVPAFNSTGTVSAQKGQKASDDYQVSTEMISRALKLGTASDLAVFAENGIINKGTASVKGGMLSLTEGQDENALKVRKDFSDSFSAMNQLPCTELADTDLSGKTYGPGIYCMSSARLAGQVILDGQGDANAFFIFRVRGNLNAEKGSGVSLINDAIANAVHFVAGDTATIGEGSNFKGSILARNSIMVNDDASVEGRTLSLKGDVSLGSNVVLGPQQMGVLQICKELDTTRGTGLEGRVFRFQVGSPALIVEVVEGQCSGVITVPAGPGLVIEELLTGRTVTGGTFNGNFQLVAVNPLGQTPAANITARNLPLRQATVTIRAGDVSNQIRVQFVNRFAVTGFIEICKEGMDSGVDSFFTFTIAEVVDAAGVPVTFIAPTGQCTGPIAVTVPAIPGGIVNDPLPRTGVVNVTEAARTGVIFAGGFTAQGFVQPFERFLGINFQTRTIRAVVVEGGVANQTTIFFFNRTLGQLKICKIAGPGIPEFFPFTFVVNGLGPTFPPNVNGNDPGTQVAATVTVRAGTVANPQCEEVPLTFLGDSTISITELLPQIFLPGNPNATEIRVTRITSTSGILTPVVRAPNVPFFPPNSGAASTRTVTVPARRETVEVEFVNVAFVPVPLKVCKIAGAGVAQNTPFTFNATTGTSTGANMGEDPSDLFPTFTSPTLTVLAGPTANGQNGFCDFIAGPGLPTTNGLGSFNAFTPVTVTEVLNPGTVATSIFSPTTVGTANLAARSFFFNTGLINSVNEVIFVNAAAAPPLPNPGNKTKRFRMQF